MGFSANSLGRLNLEIGYSVDKSGLNQIKTSLSDLMNSSKAISTNISAGMKEANAQVKQLTGLLAASTNAQTGALDVAKFSTGLTNAGMSLSNVRNSLSAFGHEGVATFSTLNKQLLSAQTTMTKTEGIAAQLGKTFTNTFLYSFSYRIVGSFIQGISNAVSYVKDLDKALTDIRIVTKESSAEMDRFAEKANVAAKNLGVSTKAYTEAALIFTQQGLKGKERDVKTETTMKVANVTGDDAAEVSQNLTAVWNGYKISSDQAEAAIDKLANVAAHSASNLAELSTGMSKVASAANTMGVSEDQLVSQLSTIESVTRQAPESIGTALKTIYARMGDLKVKGTDEFGTSLGEVSSKLQTMGIDILDQEGNMKEMGTVIEEVAGKWDTWTKAQQQAAAIAMAGKRQYNNLISLFSNWDMYEQNMQYAQNSEGEIEAQQQIYLESIEGLQGKAKAAWEQVYSNLIDADSMKGVYETIAGIGDAIANLGDSLPLAAFVMIGNILNSKIVSGVTSWTLGLTKAQQQANFIKIQQDAINEALKETRNLEGQRVFTNQEIVAQTKANSVGLGIELRDKVLLKREEASLANSLILRREIQAGLNEEEQEQFQNLANQEATASRIIAQETERMVQKSEMLGLSKEELTISNDCAIAGKQISDNYKQGLDVLNLFVDKEKENFDIQMQLKTLFADKGKNVMSLTTHADSQEAVKKVLLDVGATEEQANAGLEIFNKLVKQSKGDVDNFKESLEQLTEDWNNSGVAARNAGSQFKWAKEGKENIAEQGSRVQALSAAYMGLTNSLFGVSMGLMSIQSLWKTINDPNTSGVEKVTSTLMSLGMVIMSISQAYKGFSALMGTVVGEAIFNQTALNAVYADFAPLIGAAGLQELKEIAIKEAGNGKKKEAIMLAMMEAKCLQGVNDEKKEEIIELLFESKAIDTQNVSRKGGIKLLYQEMAARIKNIALKIQELAVTHPYITAGIALAAVIAGIAVAYANTTTKEQDHIEALQENQKEVYKTNESLKEMTDKYEDLKSSLSELEDEYTTLETLKQGTEEWDEQVLKINGHIAELLNQFPQLAEGLYTDENGVFQIKDSAISKVRSNIASGVEQQQQKLLSQQAEGAELKKVTIADEMSNVVEKYDIKAAFLDEYSEDMMEAIEDSTIKSVSDLQNKLKQQGVPIEKSQAASVFALMQEARAQDIQKINLLKQSAAIARKNSDLNLKGKGKTEQEKEENEKAKKDTYDNWYANAKDKQQKKKNDFYEGTEYDPGFFDKWIALDRSGEESHLLSKDRGWFAWDDTYGIDTLLDSDSSENLGKYFNKQLKNFLPDYLKDYAPTAKELGWSTTEDFDILKIAEEKTGVNKGGLDYKNGVGVVKAGTDELVSNEFGFENEGKAIRYVEEYVADKAFDEALNNFLKGNLDIEHLSTKLGHLSSKYIYGKDKKSDYANVDVSDIQKGDWSTQEEQEKIQAKIDKETDETKRKRLEAQKKLLQQEEDSVGQAIKDKVMGTKEEKGLYSEWNKSVQAAYDTGNIDVAQSQQMDRMVTQVREGLKKKTGDKKTSIEKAYDKLAEEGGGEIDGFNKALESIDWSKPLDVDSIKASFEQYGVNVKDLDLNWKKIAEEAQRITKETADVAGNLEKYNQKGTTFLSLIEGLKSGDTISAEDYKTALKDAANQEDFEKSFSYDARKKRYIYLGVDASGNPDPSKSGIKKAMMGEGAENAITSAKKITNQFETSKKENEDGSQIDLKNYTNLEYQKEKDRGTDYHNDVKKSAFGLVQKAYENDRSGAYKTLTEMGGGDYREMLKLMMDDSGKGLFKWNDKGEVVGWNEKYRKDYEDKYNEWLKATRTMQSGIEAGSFDSTKTGVLSTALQTDSKGVTDMYSKINTYASDATEDGKIYDKQQKHAEALAAINAQAIATAESLGGTKEEESNFTAALDRANPKIKEQSDLLLQVAGSSTYNMVKGVEKLSTLFTDTYKDAKKGTTQYYQMLSDVANTANDAFGTDFIDEGFVENHLNLFKKMAKGSKSAIKEIQLEILKTNKTSLGIKFTGLKKTQSEFWSLVQSLQNANVSIDTNLNTVEFFKQLATAISQMEGMTVGKMNEIFSNMSISLEWAEGVSDDAKTKDLNITDKKGNYNSKKANQKDGNQLIGGFKVVDKNANFKGAAAAGAKNSSSGSGSNKPNYEYMTTDKNDIDHLHDLKQAMEDLSKSLEQLKNQQEGLFGQSLIDNLTKQNKLIKEQNENLQKQYKIQTKDLGQSQTDMRKLYGFRFNSKGRISNYKKVLNARYNAYRDYVKKYNKLSAKQQEGKKGASLKADIEKAKTIWTEAKDAASKFDELYNARQDNLNKMLENFNVIAENNIKKLTAMSEALKSVNEVKQTTLDIDKEMFHASNDYGYLSQYNLKSAKLAKQELAQQTKELNKTNKAIEKLKKKGFSKTYSTQMKSLVDTQSTLIKNIETSMKKIKDSVLANIEAQSQVWKEYADNMGKVIDQLQSIVKLTQTYSDVSKLIFGEDAYDKFKAYDEQQFIANLAILDAKNKELEAAEKREASVRQALEAAQAANDAATIEKTQKELDEAIAEHNKLKEEVASSGKDAVDNAINIYTYGVKQTLKELTNSLSSGYGWDVISNTMKLEKSYSDEWLDNAQRIGNITQLTAEFDQEIAKAANSSASAQQKILQCKQEQLANLEKIDKLTQYDIERARLKMSLTLKQIALEEARENKSRLRLKRDSQGNYSYQYGADLEAIKKAEEEEAAARLKVNEEDQKEFQRLANQRLDLMKQYTDEEEKYWEKIRTAENEEEKKRFEQEWKDRQTYITNMLRHNENSLNTVQKTYLENDSALGYYNDIQGTKYTSTKQMTEKDYNQYREFLYGEEGLLPSYDSGFSAIEMSTDEFVKQSKKALNKNEKELNKLQDNFDKIGKTGDVNFKSVIKGSDNVSGIIGATTAAKQASVATQNLTNNYINLNTILKNSAVSAINLYNTMTGSAAKNAINSAANAVNNAENFKANTKAAMEYITNNASNVITATKGMSDEAKTLRDNWEGVYKAAKKAAKQINNASSGDSSGGGGGADPTYTPTIKNNKKTTGNSLKKESTTLPPGYTVKKGKNKNWYVYENGRQVMNQEYSKKKEAIKAANRLANAKNSKPTKTDGKINTIDAGSFITLKKGHGNKKIASYKKTKKGFSKIKNGKVLLSAITSLRKPQLTKDMTSKYVKVNTLYSSGVGPPSSYNYWFTIESIRKHFKGFDTGGYTGTWNNKNGRLALLHQKEIVLNKQDTANFLQAVKLTRMFAQDLGKYKTGLVDKITAISNNNKMINTNNSTQSQALRQDININATFPNVSSSSEIEKAFQQLSAKATQYAWSNKIK